MKEYAREKSFSLLQNFGIHIIRRNMQNLLADLGLDYVDLYLIHFPIALKFVPFETRYPPEWFYDPTEETPVMVEESISYRETWEAMEELSNAGLCKNIGVSNINCCMIRDLMMYAKVLPAVL